MHVDVTGKVRHQRAKFLRHRMSAATPPRSGAATCADFTDESIYPGGNGPARLRGVRAYRSTAHPQLLERFRVDESTRTAQQPYAANTGDGEVPARSTGMKQPRRCLAPSNAYQVTVLIPLPGTRRYFRFYVD